MPVRAVTFDFWRTLFRDTGSKERHRARIAALVEIGGVEPERAKPAMKHVMEEFLRVHIAEQRTLHPGDAIPILETFLGTALDRSAHDPLATAFAEAILVHRPELIEDALEAVVRTSEFIPVGIISDTGISPGSSLERLLADVGAIEHFRVLTFSDRVGVAKPQAAMYQTAARGLDCRPDELLHIGDLEPTDVVGALRVGAKAALFAGDNTRFAETTTAHHVFRSWRDYLEGLDTILEL